MPLLTALPNIPSLAIEQAIGQDVFICGGGVFGENEDAVRYSRNPCLHSAVTVIQKQILDESDARQRKKCEEMLSSLIIPCAMLECMPPCRSVRLQCECGKIQEMSVGGGGLLLPLRSLAALPQQGLQIQSLPDLGDFIRINFIRRYYSSKHQHMLQRTDSWFENKKKKTMRCKGKTACIPPSLSTTLSASWLGGFLQDCIPCIVQQGRRNTRLHTHLAPTVQEADSALALLYGTLLKLYSKGHKVPTFSARVTLCARIIRLLREDLSVKKQFIETHPHLLRMCGMEYCINIMEKFMPSEFHALQQHGNVLDFRKLSVTMFDSFRRDFVITGEEDFLLGNTLAKSGIDRCMRSFKGGLSKTTHARRFLTGNLTHIPDFCWTIANTNGNIQLCTRLAANQSSADIRTCAHIQKMIQVYELPAGVRRAQHNTLQQRFSHCDSLLQRRQMCQICALCAVNGKAYYGELSYSFPRLCASVEQSKSRI